MPWNSGGGGTSFECAGKEQAHQLDEADAEPEGDKELILMRTVIEVADDDALHHHAQHHHEQRARNHRDDERTGIFIGHEAGVTADHEHRAMREVEHAERAVDDGQPGADQRQQGTERQPVEYL